MHQLALESRDAWYDNLFAQHPLQEVTFGCNELHWAALRFEREMVQEVRKGLEAAPN